MYFLTLFLFFSASYYVCHSEILSEYVPVLIWDNTKLPETVPALHRINEESFKKSLTERIDSNKFVVVFAEQSLSAEDFSKRDENDASIFPNLSKLKDTIKLSYKPQVKNPLGVLKSLDTGFTEVSAESYSPAEPLKNNLLIIDLNDAINYESRVEMLKRHDATISSIIKDLLTEHKEVVAIYTAQHASWISSKNSYKRSKREVHSQRADDVTAKSLLVNDVSLMLYTLNGVATYYKDKDQVFNITFQQATPKLDKDSVTVDIPFTSNGSLTGSLSLSLSISVNQYWKLDTVTFDNENLTAPVVLTAPRRFSYHCGITTFSNTQKTVFLRFIEFQIQPFLATEARIFGDAYDCVGFTTIPIWAGLFVTFIMLIIISFGISAMMDIRTMDRFDDPKGKTITINAAE